MPSPTGKQGKRNAMTIRKSDTRNRNAERNARRNARTTRKAIWHETQSETIDTRRKAKRHIEERNEMSGEQSETVRIYSTPTREAPKELSTFSTMREYNTDTRRRTTPPTGTHNTNTIEHTMPYIELMFVRHARKRGAPLYRRRPIARRRYAC